MNHKESFIRPSSSPPLRPHPARHPAQAPHGQGLRRDGSVSVGAGGRRSPSAFSPSPLGETRRALSPSSAPSPPRLRRAGAAGRLCAGRLCAGPAARSNPGSSCQWRPRCRGDGSRWRLPLLGPTAAPGGLAATMVAHRGACPLSTAFPSRPAPALFVLGSQAEVLGLGLLSDPEGYEA